jgi:flagellum-specific peptidoglycan hydrolase FlgJ
MNLKRMPWWFWIAAGAVVLAGGAAVGVNIFASRKEYIQRLWAAISANTSLSTNGKLILIAQAVLESGWQGTGTAAKYARNYWNVSAGSQWKGPTIGGGDTECDSAGQNCVKITQRWRQYGSDGEAVRDMISFLTDQNGGRYLMAYYMLQSGDAVGYARELRAAGYYTAALDLYTNNVVGSIPTIKSYVGVA